MPYIALITLGLSTFLALIIGVVTWQQRPQPGTTAFSVAMGGLTWLLGCMLIGNGAAVLFEASDIPYVFLRLKWLGTNLMVLGWFFFALAYTGREEYVTRRVIGIAAIIPASSSVIVLANDRLLEITASVIGVSLALPAFDPWIAWEPFDIAYIYALVFAGGILIVGMILAHRFPHPELAGLWILAIAVPFAVNVTYLAGILSPLGTPEISVDPTPLAFLLTGTMGLAAITQYDSFEKAPVARTYVVDELRAGVLVFDQECRILDFNEWLAALLTLPEDAVGRDVRVVLADRFDVLGDANLSSLTASDVGRKLQDRQLELRAGDESVHLDIEINQLEGPAGVSIGYCVLWYDVTDQKRYERDLETSNERLAYERDLKERIRDTLINVSTQGEMERAFCNSAVDGDRILSWIGERSTAGEVSIRTAVSTEPQLEDTRDYSATKPLAERALRRGETVVENDFESSEGDWAREAVETGLRSGIAIPLTHKELDYGVFCVFSTEITAFEEPEQELFADTAESLAYSIHAMIERESLRSDEPMQLVFEIHDDRSHLSTLTDASLPPDASIDVTEVRHGQRETSAIQILHPTNVEGAVVREALISHDDVRSIEPIGEENGNPSLQVSVDVPTVESEIVDLGGAVRSTTVSDGQVRVVSEFSRRADLEALLDRLREPFPHIELASRVYVDRSGELQMPVSSELTEKQLNALRTAYVSGFFHRPQQATANEVADTLGVARTTFLQHLRTAERRILASMFEE